MKTRVKLEYEDGKWFLTCYHKDGTVYTVCRSDSDLRSYSGPVAGRMERAFVFAFPLPFRREVEKFIRSTKEVWGLV